MFAYLNRLFQQHVQPRPPLYQVEIGVWLAELNSVDWATGGKSPASMTLFEQTLYRAFLADRVGYAFAAGYLSAIHQLSPTLPAEQWGVLCVTESGGNHPRAIKTTLTPHADGTYRLTGEKAFVTLAQEAQVLLIAASTGQGEDGQNQLKVVQLPRDTANLTITVLPALPFVPEVSHGTVMVEQVIVTPAQILAGDGYTDYVKRFRTIEDIYVFTGVLAHLYRIACLSQWSTAHREQMLSLLTTLSALAQLPADSAETHLILGGVIQQFQQLLGLLEWSTVDQSIRELWERDKGLLKIAGDARARRLQAAWFIWGNSNDDQEH